MKIGLVVPGFSASEADWCIPALLNTVRVLAAQHDVHVFALRYPSTRQTYSVYGATVHAQGGGTRSGMGRVRLINQTVQHILRENRQQPFDVLHGLWADEPGLTAVIAARLLRCPTVVSLMGGELVALREIDYGHQLSWAARHMITTSLKFADVVTVGSNSLYQRASRVVQPHKLRLAPLGVDTSLFYPAESNTLAGRVRLLHVASLVPVKNQRFLMQAFALVNVPDLHLHIVGDGVLRDDLHTYAHTLGVAERVHFHHHVAHDDLPSYYNAADLCLLTSHFESQSMVALEAAACGRVTIGTPVGLLGELVEPALLSTDAPTLAQHITQILTNNERHQQMREQVLQRVQRTFTLAQTTENWLSIYRSIQ